MIAYFIGGPMDLTKRQLIDGPPTLKYPVEAELPRLVQKEGDEYVARWKAAVYERNELYGPSWKDRDIRIYVYRGTE